MLSLVRFAAARFPAAYYNVTITFYDARNVDTTRHRICETLGHRFQRRSMHLVFSKGSGQSRVKDVSTISLRDRQAELVVPGYPLSGCRLAALYFP